jgi:hypothetical protein
MRLFGKMKNLLDDALVIALVAAVFAIFLMVSRHH